MKKSIFFLIILAILMLCACANEAEIGPEIDEGDDEVIVDPRIQIGFSLAGDGPFYEQLKIDIEQTCERLNYKPNILTADSAEQQQQDIMSMLSDGVKVIVINPVNGDKLETVLAECESAEVPVVSILREINGIYSSLISVEYKAVGEAAAQRAAELLSQQEEGGRCLILRSDYGSCSAQLLSDGFTDVVSENDKLTLVSETLGGSDEEEAYKQAKSKIAGEGVNFIFAQNASLAKGAVRAVKESGKQVYIAVFGGEMDLIKSVAAKEIDMAMFYGSKELAEYSIGVANEFINSVTYEPAPYIGLTINTATADNAAGFISDSLLSAQTSKETDDN